MTPLPFALYRYFDEGTRLLYIGKSGDLPTRQSAHIGRSRWMELAASSTFERFATAREVLAAEESAIKAEHPLFNVQYNDTPEARRRLRAYLDEIGRPEILYPKKAEPIPMPELPAWPDDVRSKITENIRLVLQQHALPTGHRLLVIANLLLTGEDTLPCGQLMEDLASYCGVGRTTGYRALKTARSDQ